ncbi:MAG: DUF4062 domain-containing protein [Candidatus Lokiarchaeia archaeon]
MKEIKKKEYNVFISSTIENENRVLRQNVKEKLSKAQKIKPIMSEFPTTFIKPYDTHLDTFKASIKAVDSADIFVLIINKNYGNIKPGDLKSIMELEWDEAVKKKIPQIIFIEKDVANFYELYSKLKKKPRTEMLNVLEKMGYDNPAKLMHFIQTIVKLRKSKKRQDNWYWGFDIEDPNKFINILVHQIRFYIMQFENPSLLNKGTIEMKLKKIENRFDILIKEIPDKIFDFQHEIRNYSFKNSKEKLKLFIEIDELLEEIFSLITDNYKFYNNKWEGPIRTGHNINFGGVFLSGGLVDVAFNCHKCGAVLFGDAIDVPRPNFHEDSISKSRVFGDSSVIECSCGAEFEIVADSSHGDWDINFENGYNQPDEFYYKVESDFELEADYEDYTEEKHD